ncbi:MAG: hypothetical protein JJU18_05690 [Oceanicaulis sp.]|nr:hypothetical protein [Oceanicaulis sp.]
MSANQIKIADAYTFPSNSPAIGVEKERVAKVIQATNTHKIVLLKPVIDKLRLTFSGKGVIGHIDGLQAEAYWSDVHSLAYGLAKECDDPNITSCQVDGYFTGLRVDLGGGAVATFGIKPKRQKGAAVRLEFNPSKLTETSIQRLQDAWENIEGGNIPLAAHLTSANVTRCDVAIDLLNLKLADLFVYCPDVWKVWMCSTMEGGVQTLNFYKVKKNSPFADPKKRACVMVYDKKAERESFGAEPEFGQLAHTRIELQIDKNSPLKNLPKTKFPANEWVFSRIIVNAPPICPTRWLHFLDSARFRGFVAAENMLDASDKAALDEAGAEPTSHFKNLVDKSIWTHWPGAVGSPAVASLLKLASSEPTALLKTKIFVL